MRPVKQLARVAHGSHLYGTSTPMSDHDFKGVHLPSGRGIILGRAEDHIKRDFVSKIDGTDKNAADAIDEESFSLQKFFDMLMKGDTVATEILFAPTLEQSALWGEVQATGKLLLNRQCKGFVGYCVRQAAKYGIKGSRMRAVKDVLEFLKQEDPNAKLSTIEVKLHNWSAGREHILWENIPSPNGTDLWHLDVCDRKMPMTTTIGAARDVWAKVWQNYGERARQAEQNDGIDWKAMSHAVRVAEQAIELLTTGEITFPRPHAGLLLEIKLGRHGYDHISARLEWLVEEVKRVSEHSILPAESDRSIADRLVERFYLNQVTMS
jgi:hypothetical protein